MTAQQIAQKLRGAGFIANTKRNLVFVSLKNHRPDVPEVQAALDFEIERCHIWHTPAGVSLMGLEE